MNLITIGCFLMTYWKYKNDNYNVLFNWMFIIPTLCLFTLLLSVTLFALRIKAKYSHTEIEDITIFDRDQ